MPLGFSLAQPPTVWVARPMRRRRRARYPPPGLLLVNMLRNPPRVYAGLWFLIYAPLELIFMRKNRKVMWILLLAAPAQGQQRLSDPYGAYECAKNVLQHETTRTIKAYIKAGGPLKEGCAPQRSSSTSDWPFFRAELMKGVGDYRASSEYRAAIRASENANENEPAFYYFYGEYLRNFRGPNEPLFARAEEQYIKCGKILDKMESEKTALERDKETRSRLQRSLVALHQRDGVALAMRATDVPAVSLASVFRAAETNADLDRTSDTRDYTSTAAFAQSGARKGAPLTHAEYLSLIRVETPVETFNRVRFRDGAMPVIDVFYDYRHTSNVAPQIYRPPFTFVPLDLNNLGAGVSKPFSVGEVVDVSLAGSFQQSWRKGLIEYLPNTVERINQFQGTADVARFVGRDKLNLSMLYAFQSIVPDVAGSPSRGRTFLAPAVSFDLYRPYTYGEHFQTRGIGVFGGALLDRESYPVPAGSRMPDTLVWRKDYYGGVSARGLGGGRWDVTVQPTVFSSEVQPDHTQNNSQYRTNVVLLYRIVDEEKSPGLPGRHPGTHLGFLHVVLPLRHDVARTGIDAYRNYKAGVELDAMWYNSRRAGVTFLSTIRYDFQRFYFLNKNQNLVTFGLSMGF